MGFLNLQVVFSFYLISVYFTAWGFWNFWYYSNLDQWFSFTGGAAIALANLIWVILLIHYIRKEKNDKDKNSIS